VAEVIRPTETTPMNARIRLILGIAATLWLVAPAAPGQEKQPGAEPFRGESKVAGRVVDRTGLPVAGVEVGTFWSRNGSKRVDGKLVKVNAPEFRPYRGATTDSDGRFTLETSFSGRPTPIMASDPGRKRAGIALVDPAAEPRPIEIRLEPAVRVHGRFTCDELGDRPSWTNVYMSLMPGSYRFASCDSQDATFDFVLPPGTYQFFGYGTSTDHGRVFKEVVLRADTPDVDLGVVDLPAQPLAKLYNKEPPAWHVAAARGASKGVQPKDYRGKWVLIEFWATWCGGCVGRSLPELIEFYSDHAEQRDRFEIIAFHNSDSQTLEDVDVKTAEICKALWGEPLPFPILLDTGRKTFTAYGIQSLPTVILIDPEGRLVKGGGLEQLKKALPTVSMPMDRRIARALDRQVSLFFPDGGTTLQDAILTLNKVSRVPVVLDRNGLEAAGVAPGARLPLTIAGTISLPSALDLILRPFGLVAVPGDEGLIVKTPPKGYKPTAAPFRWQRVAAERIESKLSKPTSFAFRDQPLSKVVRAIERLTSQKEGGETVVLDPAGRLSGAIDPEARVTGSSANVPLRQALAALLDPLGLTIEVRDEMIVIVARFNGRGDRK
jgi:thiol-disulfide isomerase/thioredoxin